MRCYSCGGKGCDQCNDGVVEITSCPKKQITSDIVMLLKMSEIMDTGIAPVSGGVLDQTQCFIDAYIMVKQYRDYWKRKNQPIGL